MQHVHQLLKIGEVSISKVLEIINISVQNIKAGRPTYLNAYVEALVIELSEIEGANGILIDINTLGYELQLVIKAVNA